MDKATFASHMLAVGVVKGFRPVGHDHIQVTWGSDPNWDLSDYGADEWLITEADAIRALMFLENLAYEACAQVQPEAFVLLDTGDVLRLRDSASVAALGTRLARPRGVSPAAYAQVLARTQCPGYQQDWRAQVIEGPDDVGEELAGHNLPAVHPPKASHDGDKVHLTFCSRRRWWPPDAWAARVRIDQWQVTATAETPATWQTETIYETATP